MPQNVLITFAYNNISIGYMKIRFLLATAILLFVACLRGNAQSFYELTYTDPDNDKEHVGLLIYYSERNCTMRIVNEDMIERDAVADSKYIYQVDGKESKDDVGVIYYQPKSEGMPYLIWAWTKDDGSDISELPQIAFDIEDSDSWFEATSFTEVMVSDMDEEYIAQFYSEDEKEYKMLTQGVNLVHNQHSNVANGEDDDADETYVNDGSTTLRLIVVANTNVSDIGAACTVDLKNVRNEFKSIAQAIGVKYAETLVSGDNYGKKQLAKAVNNMKPGSNDIVVFIYTGHGFRYDDQKDYYPMLDLCPSTYSDLDENCVSLSSIYNALKDKGERLCLVMSDCCNSYLGSNRPSYVTSNTLFSRSNDSYDVSKLKDLFLNQKGTLIATAASPGEYSWCSNDGGFFLLGFMQGVRSEVSAFNGSDSPSWNSVIDNAIKSAASRSNRDSQCQAQNGMKYVRMKGVNK